MKFALVLAFFANGWFVYPSNTYLKDLRPEITRFDTEADIVIYPGATKVTLLDTSVDSDGETRDSGTRCDLVVTPAPDYRRIPAGTALALRSLATSGDPESASESSRARIRLTLESAGGFPAALECSSWYVYEPSDPEDDWSVGSRVDQTPSTLNGVFRVLRKETIISR